MNDHVLELFGYVPLDDPRCGFDSPQDLLRAELDLAAQERRISDAYDAIDSLLELTAIRARARNAVTVN